MTRRCMGLDIKLMNRIIFMYLDTIGQSILSEISAIMLTEFVLSAIMLPESDLTGLSALILTRDVEAEVEAGSGGSGPFSVKAEARKTYRFRFHISYLT